MRLKKLAALCGKSKTVIIKSRITPDGVDQYISDGRNLYSAAVLPLLDEETVLNVLDVPGPKQDQWSVQKYDWDPADDDYISDYLPGDQPLKAGTVSIADGHGSAMLPLFTKERQVMWIEFDAIEPIRDAMYEFWLRTPGGGSPFVVVKAGMFAIAAIMPIAPREATMQDLREIVTLMERKTTI